MNIFTVAPIFSDYMILQRDTTVRVWGTGTDGDRIEVKVGTSVSQATVRDNRWTCSIAPQRAGTTGFLTVSNGSMQLSFHDVLFGDVWLAGGQSNMELELQHCLNGSAELADSAHPSIRFYQVLKRSFVDDAFEVEEKKNRWQVCGPETAAQLSAVAYFFARNINAETGIPIGIINCNWGGTSISAWMSEQKLAKTVAGQQYLDEYAKLVGDKTDEQYDQEIEAYFNDWRAWDERVQTCRTHDPAVSWEVLNAVCGECPWPQPAGKKSPYRPANLYHAMIRRVAPFSLKGFLYYQGEEDWNRANDYGEMLRDLIDQWRTDWADDSLPFLFVQLPMYASHADVEAGLEKDESWQILRENQYKVSRTVANTGLAVIIDCGEFDNIHPLDKQTVGFRLALHALKKVYGYDCEADGPIFRRFEREAGAIRLYFDHAIGGLEARGVLKSFEVAGADGILHPAHARIERNTVILTSPDVQEPEHARYAWIKYGPTPLYGKNGIPAMPFRT
ncbi:MAG: sialate O-acetylesterase [Treponema sp.]|jgi:sialate O-acetylesterase|nr:sialate O-acetylesterase [Treponema sp.]